MTRALGILGLIAFGYVLGASRAVDPPEVAAQQLLDLPSTDTIGKIKLATTEIDNAANDLKAEGMYKSATSITNPFAVMVGGVDAIEDLQTGRGVDPFTYAALHAGLAVEEVKIDLGQNAEGKLVYKDRIITMYSIERLKKLFEKQQRLLDGR